MPGSFTEAVEAISVSTELVVEELTPHLDILLTALQDGSEWSATPWSVVELHGSTYEQLA